jgi:hypothetical protein
MPLVLTENEENESDITYADRTGISYQYPRMYQRIIQAGERFVYYRGRRQRGGGRAPQVYFGVGVVGEIQPDPEADGRLVCSILDYRPFAVPVPFKDGNGEYFEYGAERRGYFQRGVRGLSEEDFRRILEAADASGALATDSVTGGLESEDSGRPPYAVPEIGRAVEDFAVQVANEEIHRRYPDGEIVVQPRNNPGFDILVRGLDDGPLYVEVKGTQRSLPLFFATDGELQFSHCQAERFRLIVVYGVDLLIGSYSVLWHEGSISAEAGIQLKPVQWMCAIRPLLE